jgi:hypothetical protein
MPYLKTLVFRIWMWFLSVDTDRSGYITATELRKLAWAAEQSLILYLHYYVRVRADKGGLDLYVSCVLWPCGMGPVAEMRCVAFEIDTVKLLMSIFVRDFGAPELFTIHA